MNLKISKRSNSKIPRILFMKWSDVKDHESFKEYILKKIVLLR